MIDLDALKARLAEYDDARPRCQGKVARTTNCAPDHLTSKDEAYHEYDFTTYSPCCRPEGHAGDCRNSRSILGWPGFVIVSALVAEVERLREENESLVQTSADLCPRCNWRFVVPGEGCLNCDRDQDGAKERAAVVAWLRDDPDWPSCVACRDASLYAHADAIERGEHRRKGADLLTNPKETP